MCLILLFFYILLVYYIIIFLSTLHISTKFALSSRHPQGKTIDLQQMQQRYLNFNNFINQRAVQIQKFTQILKADTNKRTHQSLPKSVRRRAMSHNRYRIPLKLRKPLQAQLLKNESMQRLPKCRKNIRKRHRLILSYKMRSGKCRWLNTHLWAAKRMRMERYAGYKIAYSPNNKSFRSAYRYFRNNACLFDYSYLTCMTIKCSGSTHGQNQMQVQQDQRQHGFILPRQIELSQDTIKSAQSKVITQYNKIYQARLYNYQQESQKQRKVFICPLYLMIQSCQTIHCLFDPYALQDIQDINKKKGWKNIFSKSINHYIKNMSMDNKRKELVIQIQLNKIKPQLYMLIGPQSLMRVKQCIQKLGIADKNIDQQNEILQILQGGALSLATYSNKLLYLNCHAQQQDSINKTIDRPMISEPLPQRIVEDYDYNDNAKLRQLFYKNIRSCLKNNKCNMKSISNMNQITKHLKQQEKATDKHNKVNSRISNNYFWEFYQQLDQRLKNEGQKISEYIQKITNRSKYTHKRNNKLTRQEKKKIVQVETPSKGQIGQKQSQNQQMLGEERQRQEQPQMETKKIVDKYSKSISIQQIPKLNKDPIIISPFYSRQSKKQCIYQGCFIFCSAKNNCQIWRALSQTNVKVIGRKQMRNCVFESGLRYFPDDYPQSICFQRYNRIRAMELIDKHKKLPNQKRISYEKINSPYPFYFFQDKTGQQINNTAPIRASIVSRGRCFTGSYICRLTPQDYQIIGNQIDKTGVIKSIISQQINQEITQTKDKKKPQQLSSIDYKTQSYQQIIEFLSQSSKTIKREIIGFITYGTFSQSQCRQAGVGYVFNKQFIKNNFKNNVKGRQDSIYVLIRKPTSRFYYLATIELCNF